jgi:large subunit ribosomal protein L4
MPTLDVLDTAGQKVAQIELSDEVFGAENIKEHLLWEMVRSQRAAKRAGTAAAKGRSQVRGGGQKPYRQKGTGRARQGSIRAPNHVGGGVVFPPKPRKYDVRVPKKVRRAALRSALALRASEQKLVVMKDLELAEIKTKAVAEMLEKLETSGALIVESKENRNLALSTRNLANHKLLAPEGLNVYDILRYPTLVVTQDVAKAIDEKLKPEAFSRGRARRTK